MNTLLVVPVLLLCASCQLLQTVQARIDNKFAVKYKFQKPVGNGVEGSREEDNGLAEDGANPHVDDTVSLDTEDTPALHNKGHRKHDKRPHRGHHPEGHHGNQMNHHGKGHHGRDQKVSQAKQHAVEKVVEWKQLKPSRGGQNLPNRNVWKKVTNFEPSDSPLCDHLRCKRKHLCMVNSDTNLAECVHRRLLKQRKKPKKARISDHGDEPAQEKKYWPQKKHKAEKKEKELSLGKKKASKLVKNIKDNAKQFKDRYEKRHHLHRQKNMESVVALVQPKDNIIEAPVKKSDPSDTLTDQGVSRQQSLYCSQRELSALGKELLDWFKQGQQMEEQGQSPHIIQKRNSKKKELHEPGECICQAPARWQFHQLDTDGDSVLSPEELHSLKTGSYQRCAGAFIQSCDHDQDGWLSDREWCCCFSHILPPCLTKLQHVPSDLVSGAPILLPGAYVPQCDSDGFYKKVQCHSSTGYCWCVDIHGNKLVESDTRGTPSCGADLEPEQNDLGDNSNHGSEVDVDTNHLDI